MLTNTLWLVLGLRPLEFLLQIYILNGYGKDENGNFEIYRKADIDTLLLSVANLLIENSKDLKSTKAQKKALPIAPLGLYEIFINIIEMVNRQSGISFLLYIRILAIARLNYEVDTKFSTFLFRVISNFGKIEQSDGDNDKLEKVKASIETSLKAISNCRDIVSFNKQLEYLKAFKMTSNDPEKRITLDPYSEKCMDELLTYGCIRDGSEKAKNVKSAIDKAYNAISKQDLSNNCQIDISRFVPDHVKFLNQSYNFSAIVEKCIEYHRQTSKILTNKSLEDVLRLKET